jgi:hypothetical protein
MLRTSVVLSTIGLFLILPLAACGGDGDHHDQGFLYDLGEGLAINIETELYKPGGGAVVQASCFEAEDSVRYECDVYKNTDTPNIVVRAHYTVRPNPNAFEGTERTYDYWLGKTDSKDGFPSSIAFDQVS